MPKRASRSAAARSAAARSMPRMRAAKVTFSSAVRRSSRPDPSLSTPVRRRTASPSTDGSMPSTRIRPRSGRRMPLSSRIVVVLPAPFGPSSATTSPGSTRNVTPSRARSPPKARVSSSVSMVAGTSRSLAQWQYVSAVPDRLAVPVREAEVVADVDVCVAGGGPAGLGAALAAARLGARVCLLERHAFLGGNFTAASVGTVCGLYVSEGDSFSYVTRGIAEEVAEALKAQGSAFGPMPFKGTAVLLYVPWAAKRLFDHLATDEERITLFLHALV